VRLRAPPPPPRPPPRPTPATRPPLSAAQQAQARQRALECLRQIKASLP
jgi:hypothetical protein